VFFNFKNEVPYEYRDLIIKLVKIEFPEVKNVESLIKIIPYSVYERIAKKLKVNLKKKEYIG